MKPYLSMAEKAESVGCLFIQAGESTVLRCLVRVPDKAFLGMDGCRARWTRPSAFYRRSTTQPGRRTRCWSLHDNQGASHGHSVLVDLVQCLWCQRKVRRKIVSTVVRQESNSSKKRSKTD